MYLSEKFSTSVLPSSLCTLAINVSLLGKRAALKEVPLAFPTILFVFLLLLAIAAVLKGAGEALASGENLPWFCLARPASRPTSPLRLIKGVSVLRVIRSDAEGQQLGHDGLKPSMDRGQSP